MHKCLNAYTLAENELHAFRQLLLYLTFDRETEGMVRTGQGTNKPPHALCHERCAALEVQLSIGHTERYH